MTETITVQVRALRENLRDILDAVMLGNHISITRHGKEVAVLTSPQWHKRAAAALAAAEQNE